jgi:hypothetical protein
MANRVQNLYGWGHQPPKCCNGTKRRSRGVRRRRDRDRRASTEPRLGGEPIQRGPTVRGLMPKGFEFAAGAEGARVLCTTDWNPRAAKATDCGCDLSAPVWRLEQDDRRFFIVAREVAVSQGLHAIRHGNAYIAFNTHFVGVRWRQPRPACHDPTTQAYATAFSLRCRRSSLARRGVCGRPASTGLSG